MNASDSIFNLFIGSSEVDFACPPSLQTRIKHDLLGAGIYTVKDLVSMDPVTFAALPYFGIKERRLIKDYLGLRGLTLGMRLDVETVVEKPSDFETWFSSINPLRLSIREIAEQAFNAGRAG